MAPLGVDTINHPYFIFSVEFNDIINVEKVRITKATTVYINCVK